MTNDFALNHDKSLQIYFFFVKCQAKKQLSKRCQKHSKYLDAFISYHTGPKIWTNRF